jgi:RNA polymerase sigma factor for flagellar operon FliA
MVGTSSFTPYYIALNSLLLMQQKTCQLDEKLLWDSFLAHSDHDARKTLIEKYTSFVKIIAASIYSQRNDDEVDFEDYLQYGMIGLIESIDRYKPEKGAVFRTFATYRIRGSILNGLTKSTERHEQNAYRTKLRKERLNSITTDYKTRKDSLFSELVEVALGMAICYMLEDTGLVQDPSKVVIGQDEEASELALLKLRLVESVKTLPERERLIVEYHYFKHADFNELSDILGVTKGRVSQIHKRALALLRDRLGGWSSLDESF